MSLTGWGYCHLANAKDDGRWPHCPVSISARKVPFFSGSVSDFLKENPELETHMSNNVKICPRCTKSCGRTLHSCNNCAFDISSEEVQRSENALMAFVYGIGSFPTSIRYQDESLLVYDDLMQTTVIHLNSIPTNFYIPDFRYLFSDPLRGLSVINSLFKVAKSAAVERLSSESFRRKFFSPRAVEMMDSIGLERFVEKYALCGFNYPPSQCQLHLQFILPPYVPYHAVLLADGKHSEIERFFVFEFIQGCLEQMVHLGISIKIEDISDLSGRELIALLKSVVNTDYYHCYYKTLSRHRANDKIFSNWTVGDFESVVVDNRLVFPVSVIENRDVLGPPIEEKVPDLVKRDRAVISSYGKGIGLQYYTFSKQPGDVPFW